jgi:hypothetical protein
MSKSRESRRVLEMRQYVTDCMKRKHYYVNEPSTIRNTYLRYATDLQQGQDLRNALFPAELWRLECRL